MENSNIIKLMKEFENRILEKLSLLEKEVKNLKNNQSDNSKQDYNKLFYQKLYISPLTLCLGEQLYNHLMNDPNTDFPSALAELRSKLLENYGYIIPAFEINYLESLTSYEYMIFFRNELVHRETLKASNNALEEILEILENNLFINADKIITREEIWNFIKIIEETDATITKELINKNLSIATIRQTMVNLLKEKVSIKDIRLIFEKILEYKSLEPKPEDLSEYLRQFLSYSILNKHIETQEKVLLTLLSTELENDLYEAFKTNNSFNAMILGELIFENLLETDNLDTILMVHPKIRLNLYKIMEKYDPSIVVLSSSELNNNFNIDLKHTIEVSKCHEIDASDFSDYNDLEYKIINIKDETNENN